MNLQIFLHILDQLKPEYTEEIDWQENLKPCNDPYNFFMETCWVILNSGMKEQIARIIWDRIKIAWAQDIDISTVFKHKGKVSAIKYAKENYNKLFSDYVDSDDKINFLKTIPFIGEITCYHLAKNLGHNCIKPDRHLVRISKEYNTTPYALCLELSELSGFKIATVDIILWRAANLGII